MICLRPCYENLIVAFAFGAPSSVWSNAFIASTALDASLRLDAPIFTQPDTGSPPGTVNRPTITIAEPPGKPAPTLRIARTAVQWAKQNGVQNIHIVAAAPHLWRCRHDLALAIHEAGGGIDVHVAHEKEFSEFPRRAWFCAEGTQWYTNSRIRWYLRDSILRYFLVPLGLYRFVAS